MELLSSNSGMARRRPLKTWPSSSCPTCSRRPSNLTEAIIKSLFSHQPLGSTGKAALEGFSDVEGVSIFVFYPHGGVSEIQRLQMATQRGSNTGACAVIGNFDDAQTGVKKIFSDSAVNRRLEESRFRLSSANSINWGRLAPQIAYYYTAYEEMVLSGKVTRRQRYNICVPTGNFGNILAAYYAIRCGLPVSKLICASNINKVLTEIHPIYGIYDRRREFLKTESPSMDILISSNLERLLFELVGRNPGEVSNWMNQLSTPGMVSDSEGCSGPASTPVLRGVCRPQRDLNSHRKAFRRIHNLLDGPSLCGWLQCPPESTGRRPGIRGPLYWREQHTRLNLTGRPRSDRPRHIRQG